MSYTNAIQWHVDRLDDALTVWADRDDTTPQAGVRQAANVAVESIDALLQDLHVMRSALLAEIRQSDDATAARADALIARLKTSKEGN